MTTAQVEDLLMEKVKDLGFFKVVQSMGRENVANEVEKVLTTPAALVCFLKDENTGVRSRLVVKETYGVVVVAKNMKSEKDAAAQAYDLIDAVRDGVHGKQWGHEELEPFELVDRELISYASGKIAYMVRFSTRHMLGVPTTE